MHTSKRLKAADFSLANTRPPPATAPKPAVTEAAPRFGVPGRFSLRQTSNTYQPVVPFFWGGQPQKAIMNIITKNGSTITRVTFVALAILAMALLGASVALAESSGNFTATVQTTQCTMNTTPGFPNSGALIDTQPVNLLTTTIRTPNSKFTTLLIRPSLVTGLFTSTGVDPNQYSGNSAAVRVFVLLDGKPVAPATSAQPGIIYDKRFQQLSMADASAMTTCAGSNDCDVALVMSTLAAHSFDFVAPDVGGGDHTLQVGWRFHCTDNTGAEKPCANTFTPNTAGACAGPGSVTVTQVKNFSTATPIVIAP